MPDDESLRYRPGVYRSCVRKCRHPDKASAKRAQRILAKQGVVAVIYRCDYCKGFHCGKQSAATTTAVLERIKRR